VCWPWLCLAEWLTLQLGGYHKPIAGSLALLGWPSSSLAGCLTLQLSGYRCPYQRNLKTSPGPPRGVMVPLVLLVHADPPWSTFSVKFQKVWIGMDRSGPGGPQGPQPPLVDQERSGLPWTTLRHFPDAIVGLPSHAGLVARRAPSPSSPGWSRQSCPEI